LIGRWYALALLVGALGIWVPSRVAAQDTVVVVDAGPGRPGRLLREILAKSDTRVIVALGDPRTRVAKDSTQLGTLVVLGPNVVVEGRVRGDIVVVGGDLFVHPGAEIGGRAIAIGGGVYPSRLATIRGGSARYQDITFDATRNGGVIELRYRSLIEHTTPFLTYPGLFGVRLPTYDRTNGLSLSYGPLLTLDAGDVELDPTLTYRSQLGVIDPSVGARMQLSRRTRVEAVARRGTFSNERWITGDLKNSASALVLGRDTRNWWRADRIEVVGRKIWEKETGTIEPYAGLRHERAWSVRPGAPVTGGPWSIFGRRSDEGMWRPNPPVTNGTITSALGGVRLAWEDQAIVSRLDVDAELPFTAPADARFLQLTLDGQIAFPTFGTQRFTTDLHAIATIGDPAPAQRWSYLGGSGTIPTLDLLELGGEQLVIIDSRYDIPLERIKVPLVGSPVLTIRNVLGGAGTGGFPSMIEMLGARLSVAGFRVEVLADTRDRKVVFKAGLGLTR
jgi:hypothetical protein